MGLRIIPFKAGLGADIAGLDVTRPIEPDDAARLRRAWGEHLVLRLRELPMTDQQHMAFSRVFGEIELSPAGVLARDYGVQNKVDYSVAVPPEITVVSNIVENGKPAGDLGAGELEWHTDASFLDHPPAGSALRALEAPAAGGETGFINMYAALEALPNSLRRRLEGLELLHSRLRSSDGKLRRGFENVTVTDPSQAPGARHPAIRTHPDTGRKALFLGRRRDAYVIGCSLADSESLLDEVWAHTVQERFTWHQDWRVGDLVIWDNRSTMHRRNPFDPGARRRMHRTQIIGRPMR
jgi:taurine dioxygenase